MPDASVASRNLQLPDFHLVAFGDELNPSVVFAEPLVLRADAEDEGLLVFGGGDRQHESAVLPPAPPKETIIGKVFSGCGLRTLTMM